MTHCDKCKGKYGANSKICSSPRCTCHQTEPPCKHIDECYKDGFCMMCGAKTESTETSGTETNYNQIDHSHCWEEDEFDAIPHTIPPCGQRIKHLKCCLCEVLNPQVKILLTKAKEEEQNRILDILYNAPEFNAGIRKVISRLIVFTQPQ